MKNYITGALCVFIFLLFCSCGLATAGGDDEYIALEESYFLEVKNNIPIYNVGDCFDKMTDFTAYKHRYDGKMVKIPNANCKVIIDKYEINSPTVPFYMTGDTMITVEHDGLTDFYKAKVLAGGGLGGDGGGGLIGGGSGGGIGITWNP
ncbi:MAG: hypothetical protein LBG74_06560 [Spirochaetaceae bacterium]|jgi:hypothetical protein|nr:hypothetical protein [Spirochaetaceae bacterium]